MGRVSPRRARPQRLDQDRTDANHLGECAAALRTETSQARYTNRQRDPYPLYVLAELFDTIGREVSTGQLDPRNPIRRSAVALASRVWPNHRCNAVANRVVSTPLLRGRSRRPPRCEGRF